MAGVVLEHTNLFAPVGGKIVCNGDKMGKTQTRNGHIIARRR